MKVRKFDKKLVLNKKTISDLNNSEMGKIQGGKVSGESCPFCPNTAYSGCVTNCGGITC